MIAFEDRRLMQSREHLDSAGVPSRDVWTLVTGEHGMVPIQQLLDLPYSIDYGPEVMREYGFDEWSECIAFATEDSQYEPLVDSLVMHGQSLPVTVGYDHALAGDLIFGDGHHRLAAAIELGWSHLWVYHCRDGFGLEVKDRRFRDSVAPNTGHWSPDYETPSVPSRDRKGSS